MKSIEEKVLLFIAGEKLIAQNDKIVVGFSGGADSVFLLSFLKKFQKKFKLSLIAVHLNHNLRGEEADADESFCRNFCAELNIPILVRRKNVKAFAIKNKLSLEEAGREIRYKLFSEIAAKENCTKIATAHHQSDNTETILLNLIKGSGLNGAAGIPARRGNIIRPLLAITKDEILSYLKAKKIPFQIDSSNEENDFQRNYLRNEIIPKLKENINPKLDKKLFNFSSSIKMVLNYVQAELALSFSLINFDKKNECKIPLSLLEEKHILIQKALIAEALEKIPNVEVNFRSIEGVLNLLNKKVGATFELPGGVIALHDRYFISIKKEQKEKFKEILIEKNQTRSLFGTKITVKEISTAKLTFSSDPKVEYLSADNLKFPLHIRKWKSGDAFYPLGFSTPKKVSEFLTGLKLSAEEKANQLLLLNDSKIIWVIKRRLDNRYAVTNRTKKIIKVRCT
ncbi:MAG: tRNA lysidine(34) synthetase TilS [Ignavibacteriaceae bacterium]